VVPTMHSISPNTELATLVRLFIGLTGAFILRRFRYTYSSPQPPSGLVRQIGFAKLKNLANQVTFLQYQNLAAIQCQRKAFQTGQHNMPRLAMRKGLNLIRFPAD
jgi:hypothetical protein